MAALQYFEKLQDRRWQEKRNSILDRDGYTCQMCRDESDTSQLHVHHRYYKPKTDPWDYPDAALVTLCKDCHSIATDYNTTFDVVLKSYFSPSDLLDIASIVSGIERCGIPSEITTIAADELFHQPLILEQLLRSRLSKLEPHRPTAQKIEAFLAKFYPKDDELAETP